MPEMDFNGISHTPSDVNEDPGASVYDAQQRDRVLRRLRQRAARLGFDLLNRQTGELLDGGAVVS
jgi:hypothetical protein